jgi:hypothetical protein
VLSKKDQDMLTSHYHNGISLKGALILIGTDLSEDIVSKEDLLFLRQIEKDRRTLKNLTPPAVPGNASPWEYSSITEQSQAE